MKSCSQCGYQMEPLDSDCRKCKAQAVGAANAPASQIYGQAPQTPPAQNPWTQAQPLNQTNQTGAYQRPDYAPQKPPKNNINFNMVYGGLACLFGIVATIWGHTHALHGGSYTVFWGAILFGGVRFFRGLSGE